MVYSSQEEERREKVGQEALTVKGEEEASREGVERRVQRVWLVERQRLRGGGTQTEEEQGVVVVVVQAPRREEGGQGAAGGEDDRRTAVRRREGRAVWRAPAPAGHHQPDPAGGDTGSAVQQVSVQARPGQGAAVGKVRQLF